MAPVAKKQLGLFLHFWVISTGDLEINDRMNVRCSLRTKMNKLILMILNGIFALKQVK